MAKKIAETPLMKQYLEMKKKHPDAILLFRVGDFYETFSEDAIAASEILGITLTKRRNGAASTVELAGFPHHALDAYLPKLVRAGRRVAICEQLEDPKLTKNLVKRGITELITPGLNTAENTIAPRNNNYLAGVHFREGARGAGLVVGVAFLDITTGEFLCASGAPEAMDKLIQTIQPAELLRMHGTRPLCEQHLHLSCSVNELDDWVYTPEAARERLLKQFQTTSLKGYGVEDMEEAVIAAGSLLHYLDLTQHTQTAHIHTLTRIDDTRFVRLDRFTMRNLELVESAVPEGKSLLDVIDKTQSPMGARTLRHWLQFPLLDIDEIRRRQDAAEYFFKDLNCREACGVTLHAMGDLQRLTSKMARRKIGGRELLSLRDSLAMAGRLKETLAAADSPVLNELAAEMPDVSAAAADITRIIYPDAPNMMGKGQLIADGIDEELDRNRMISTHSRELLAEMQRRESEATGIPSLKIGFNNVFGYYIEVRNTHREKVPENWIRKQTLVSAERYITPELKEFEQAIVNAEGTIEQIETRIFGQLLDRLSRDAGLMVRNAVKAGEADCLLSFALAAEEYGYVRPVVDDSLALSIRQGRHPVIERRMPPGQAYIANDVDLDSDTQQIIMLTGPNMSGKSALLRQTALIAIMAQTGSFVPAESARIGYIDKVFTRVGASDNISGGESTFMVEMNEAAAILNNMSQRSLILFDELGRGTSTYDGISIAWSIVEHIHDNGWCRPKTLFATHYHELNEMEKNLQRVVNYNVSVKEIAGKVVFMRKLERGGSAHSFGIHVAKLAGMPPSIVKRSSQVLESLENKGQDKGRGTRSEGRDSAPAVSKAEVGEIGKKKEGYQLSFFQLDDPLLSQIRDQLLTLNIDNLTPIQALTTLHELQSLIRGK